MKSKIILFVLGLTLSIGTIQAQVARTLNVAKAGTLSTLIKSSEKNQITSLTLTGELNGADIRYIREMAGCDSINKATSGNLSILNIAEAGIVEGGGCYSSSNYTKNYTISEFMFFNCDKLIEIVLPNINTSIGISAFMECNNLTTITIPSKLISIEAFAFSICNKLTSFTIPGTVKSLGNGAFYGSKGLTSVTIPNSVTSIGSSAFNYCTGLIEIHSQMKTPLKITSDVFDYVNKNICKLYVPKGSFQSYKQANIWGDFTNIIEEDVTPINEISLNNTSVCTMDNAIIVQNAHGETISVYTPSGALLRTVKATNDYLKIEVPENHIYIVKIANNTYKVALN